MDEPGCACRRTPATPCRWRRRPPKWATGPARCPARRPCARCATPPSAPTTAALRASPSKKGNKRQANQSASKDGASWLLSTNTAARGDQSRPGALRLRHRGTTRRNKVTRASCTKQAILVFLNTVFEKRPPPSSGPSTPTSRSNEEE